MCIIIQFHNCIHIEFLKLYISTYKNDHFNCFYGYAMDFSKNILYSKTFLPYFIIVY